jgi:predicted ATPase/DNA-binding SARP family transcriptional activator
MPVKAVRLLGSVHADEIQFLADFRYQLLAYLTYQADWVSREELAQLFWSETSRYTARHNLRQLLSRLKQLTWCDVEIEKDRARWCVATDVSKVKQLPDDIDLYQGVFLQGLESGEANIFQTWLLTERELLHSRWRDAVLALVKVSESEKALTYLAKLLEQDPLDEEAVQLSLTLFIRMQQPMQAAAVYKIFVKTLEAELGLTPTSRTEQLFKEATTKSAVAKNVGLTTKPATPTAQLIGRKAECLAIADALNKQRLLTLTGPGGIGKTRLAMQVILDVRERFTDDVQLVSLESLTHPSEVPSRIAEMLNLTLLGNMDIIAQIVDHMQGKEILMILDNFEHVLEAKPFVTTLLEKCPELKIMITSREKLKLTQEHSLVIDPLPLPQASDSLEMVLTTPAAQLFVERAKRVQLEFTVTKQDLPHLVAICETLGGIPLALELAAPWVRMMSLSELASELSRNLELLEDASINRSERHRSVRAVFEHSWKYLTPKEQDMLAKLSVFRGGFTREAAAVVTRLPATLLAVLADKSFIRLGIDGRYSFHPLMASLALEKLEQAPAFNQSKEAHAKFFINFMERISKSIRNEAQADGLQKLHADLENCLLAWQWATLAGSVDDLLKARPALTIFFDEVGRFHDGNLVFSETLLHLQSGDNSTQRLKTYLLGDWAWFCYMLGDFETSLELSHQGLSVARSINDSHGMIKSLNVLASVETDTDQLEQAALHYQEFLDIARREPDDFAITIALMNMAGLQADLGNYSEAEAMYSEALTLSEQSKDTVTAVGVMNALGKTYFDMERSQEAIDIHQKSVVLCGELGLETSEIYGLRYLAEDYLAVGRRSEALEAAKRGLELAHKTGVRSEQERLEILLDSLHAEPSSSH